MVGQNKVVASTRIMYLLSPGGQPVRAGKAIPHTHYCHEGDARWTPVEAGGQPTARKDSDDAEQSLIFEMEQPR
jgi:hypothetical protein